MKNILWLGLVAVAVGFSACKPERDLTYTGPSVVEFKNDRVDAINARFLANNTVNSRTLQQGRTDSLLVQLVGPQRPESFIVTYEVDAKSTGVEDRNFRFLTQKGVVTIPANASRAYIPINFPVGIPASAPASTTVTLILNLMGNAEIPASQNYKQFTFTIRK
jgi:hypothetical protein